MKFRAAEAGESCHVIEIAEDDDCSCVISGYLYMVRPARFERAAYGFEVRRSIQLSYGRMFQESILPHLLRHAVFAVDMTTASHRNPCSYGNLGS